MFVINCAGPNRLNGDKTSASQMPSATRPIRAMLDRNARYTLALVRDKR
jgi:hypothetical protein